MSPSRVEEGGTRGAIIPVGGAEDKVNDSVILRRFAKLAGGKRARIAIIPTASIAADTGSRYESVFRELGVRDADALDFDTRSDCDRADLLEFLNEATGIFLTGGNKLRLTTTLGGTAGARALGGRKARGGPVAGT